MFASLTPRYLITYSGLQIKLEYVTKDDAKKMYFWKQSTSSRYVADVDISWRVTQKVHAMAQI